MKKIIYLACVLVFAVVGGAGAVSQNITLGPCNVSFDLGFDEPITGTYGEVHSETFSGCKFVRYDFDSLGGNMVVRIKTFVDPNTTWETRSAEELEKVYSNAWQYDVCATVGSRKIDENDGHVIQVASTRWDDPHYYTTFNALNDTVDVWSRSLYPWDEGTTNLLNSIHIEKVA